MSYPDKTISAPKMSKEHRQKIFQGIIADINWDNWYDDDETQPTHGMFFRVASVLACRIDSVIENLEIDEDSEEYDTLKMLQRYVEAHDGLLKER